MRGVMMNTILFLHGPFVRTSRIMLEGLSSFASERGWQVMHFSPPQGADASYIRRLADFWGAIGIVEDCGTERNMPLPGDRLEVPFVCVDLDPSKVKSLTSGCRNTHANTFGFVNADSDLFVQMAVKELLLHDFTSYAYVSAYHRRHWSERRREVFRQMIKDAGGDFHSFDGTHQETGDASVGQRLGEWLKSLPKPCGLLAANDRIAALVLSVAQRHGIAIPDMVSVIGIDNDEMLCENISPSLSSIEADFFQGGYLAGRCLAELLTGTTTGRGRTALTAPPQFSYGAKLLVQRLSTRRFKKQMPSVRNAVDFIHRHATEGISTSDILPLLGGSRRSAEKRFRATTGKSILEEIIDVRFEKLLPLLEHSHIALNALAEQTGFTSANQLQRQFKARFGMTLSGYRKQSNAPIGDAPPHSALRPVSKPVCAKAKRGSGSRSP